MIDETKKDQREPLIVLTSGEFLTLRDKQDALDDTTFAYKQAQHDARTAALAVERVLREAFSSRGKRMPLDGAVRIETDGRVFPKGA